MADPFIGDYHFGGPERRAYNLFPTRDEQWAYLVFARERHAAENERVANNPRRKHKYRKNPFHVMKEWRTLAPHDEDGSGRDDRIKAARMDVNRPDAVDLYEPPTFGSPGSINDFEQFSDSDIDVDGREWAQGLTYHFVRSLFTRGYRQSNPSSGSWTTVRLYVGTDKLNKVRDVVVVKAVDVQDNAKFGVSHLEDKIEHLATVIPDHDHILKPRYWESSHYSYRPKDADGNPLLTPKGKEVRIWRNGVRSFWDYCAGGDLLDLIRTYSWENSQFDDDDWKIPEKFVWHVFHSMALALYTLHTHRIYAYAWNEVEEGRGETIHRDIKPQNIFLRYKNDDKNPGYSDVYPQCVLGDFDLAELASDLKDLKDGSHIAGTHGYMAPEYLYRNKDSNDVSSKSDVWSVAGVIWDLMNSIRGADDDPEYLPEIRSGLNSLRGHKLHKRIRRSHKYFLNPQYPTHNYIQERLHRRRDLPRFTSWLTDLVDDCSRHGPKERMGVLALVRAVKKYAENVNLLSDGQIAPHDEVRLKEDPFLRGRRVNITRRRPGT